MSVAAPLSSKKKWKVWQCWKLLKQRPWKLLQAVLVGVNFQPTQRIGPKSEIRLDPTMTFLNSDIRKGEISYGKRCIVWQGLNQRDT